MNRTAAALLALAAAPLAPAAAQSINIDFGTPGTAPSSSYAGAGRAGVWNALGVIPTSPPQPLVGLWGQPLAATIYNLGGSDLLAFDHPATTGDDAALMDDMFISYNNPVDLCLYFQNLQNGTYEVVVYAMSPDSAAHQNRIRVDFSAPGPTWVGGDWPGEHHEPTTYSRHTVAVTDGRLFPHSGQFNANYRSGINGLQLILLSECYANCDASTQPPTLNVQDFGCFLTRYAAGEAYANCDGSTQAPVLNVSDFGCFLTRYAAGCP
ncbi:MAG: GC-type dockerin domain-anchored protein [Phycisphaerales bacterium]